LNGWLGWVGILYLINHST